VLPRDEVTRHLKPRHEELAAEILATVYLRKEHQKIVLIDDNLAFLGSMNVLAHRPGSRLEVMALFQTAAPTGTASQTSTAPGATGAPPSPTIQEPATSRSTDQALDAHPESILHGRNPLFNLYFCHGTQH
jgi:hypothetical protein